MSKYVKTKCEHKRRRDRCKDCGTGQCKHNRNLYTGIYCGSGYCDHGRRKYGECVDCSLLRMAAFEAELQLKRSRDIIVDDNPTPTKKPRIE